MTGGAATNACAIADASAAYTSADAIAYASAVASASDARAYAVGIQATAPTAVGGSGRIVGCSRRIFVRRP